MKELRGTEWYGEYATLTDEHNDYFKIFCTSPCGENSRWLDVNKTQKGGLNYAK